MQAHWKPVRVCSKDWLAFGRGLSGCDTAVIKQQHTDHSAMLLVAGLGRL